MSEDKRTQKQKIIERLRDGPALTIDLIGPIYGIRPSARVEELRKEGYEIETLLVKRNRYAYALISEPERTA
jgi:hypothetical protein